jgi:hypothetical protein
MATDSAVFNAVPLFQVAVTRATFPPRTCVGIGEETFWLSTHEGRTNRAAIATAKRLHTQRFSFKLLSARSPLSCWWGKMSARAGTVPYW